MVEILLADQFEWSSTEYFGRDAIVGKMSEETAVSETSESKGETIALAKSYQLALPLLVPWKVPAGGRADTSRTT